MTKLVDYLNDIMSTPINQLTITQQIIAFILGLVILIIVCIIMLFWIGLPYLDIQNNRRKK